MSEVKTKRRYCLLKRNALRRQNVEEGVWIGKQAAEPGVALPSTFPFLSKLSAVGYTAREDLDGADQRELSRNVGLSKKEAEAVLAAFAAL